MSDDKNDVMIEVRSLTKTFGERKVLNDISYTVYTGETLVILGRSGTGKSVNLKTIIGLMDPTIGTVNILGKNIHTLNEQKRLAFRKQIGYVFQGAALFDSLTVLENVGFSLFQEGSVPEREIRQKVTDRLSMVGLAHTVDQFPSELSGGMQKRVGLARALINLPKLILYDEPTSGLDPLTTDVINQIILRLRSKLKVTSVVVTHDMKSAFTIADRIIMLDQGRIVCEGTPQDIQNSENPWVQHFITGHALENERIDSALFPSIRLTLNRGSGTHPVQQPGTGTLPAKTTGQHRAQTSGLLPAVRTRRKSTSSSEAQLDVDSNPLLSTDIDAADSNPLLSTVIDGADSNPLLSTDINDADSNPLLSTDIDIDNIDDENSPT